MDVSKLARAYVKLRDARAEVKKTFEATDNDLKAKMAMIESEMLRQLQTNNIESIKTEAGTFYRQEELTPSGSDWGAFYDWVRAENAFDFLEKRIKKGSIKEYMEQHEGQLPPGVSVFKEWVVRVRRS